MTKGFKMFTKLMKLMKSILSSDDNIQDKQLDDNIQDKQLDENIGKIFTYYLDATEYIYLMTVNTFGKDNLFVILQDTQTLQKYSISWNVFFSSTGPDNARIPRFNKKTDNNA